MRMIKSVNSPNGERVCIINNTVVGWEYMEDFISALCHVDEGYYMYSMNFDGATNKIYPERIFAYELYHQYRKIMEEYSENYSGLYLNGEQTKSRQVETYIGKFSPDLVLHSRLDSITNGNQKWLCEIKMIDSSNPLSDIEKFRKMDNLRFENYIFLYAGSCLENLLLKLDYKLTHKKLNRQLDGRSICICSYFINTSRVHIECHRLDTLIDMIDKTDIRLLRKRIK